MKTIPWLMLVFALASSCRAAEGNEVATHGVAPEPWLENQASLARAGGWEEIERDALRRLMSMNPNDAGPKLEELRLAITNAVPDIGQIKELVRNLCASPDEKACREARVLQASIEPPMSDALASARLLFRAGRSAEALELYQKTFPATQGRPPESSLELEYLSVLLTIPGREAEGVKGIEALIRRTEEHGSVILSRRAASLLAHHHFERTLAEALNDIYENGTRRERAARVLEKALKTFLRIPVHTVGAMRSMKAFTGSASTVETCSQRADDSKKRGKHIVNAPIFVPTYPIHTLASRRSPDGWVNGVV